MKITDIKVGTILQVVKDMYYPYNGDAENNNEMMTYEELMKSVAHLCVKGDVYVKVDDDTIECIEGVWKGNTNEGWFDVEEMLDREVFVIL